MRLSTELVMRLVPITPLPFGEIAEELADILVSTDEMTKPVIGITGPSCVGKTTLSYQICMALEERRRSVLRISTDSFLRQELRGRFSFRQKAEKPLTPSDFDYNTLADILATLLAGRPCTFDVYSRGQGWLRNQHFEPAEFLLAEGLFLDSPNAVTAISFDLVVVLEAPSELIANWRRRRDREIREQRSRAARRVVETEHEIENTLHAYASYKRISDYSEKVFLYLDAGHRVVAVKARP